MKILITTDVYEPTVNGVVTSIINLKKELALRGHEVKVLTLSDKGCSYEQRDVFYMQSLSMGRIYPGARAAVFCDHEYIQRLEEWKPDVIHSQSEFTTYFYAKKIARKTNAPLIHTYHTVYEDYTHYFSPSETLGRHTVALLSRKLLKAADMVVAPTEKVKRLLEGYRVKNDICILPTGIDLKPFWEAAKEKKAFGRRICDAPILVTVGRVAKEKNLEKILQFLNTERGQRYHWLVVGDGPDRQHLEGLVKEWGMSGRITFTGMVPLNEVAKYYQMGDVFVSASRSETQGLTYVEALASGLPVVAWKDACLENVVENGFNGWQYETEDEFFQALEKLLPVGHRVHGWQYEMCSVNAKNSVWRFSEEAFGIGAEKLYRCLTEKRETTRHLEKEIHFWKRLRISRI